MKSVLAAALLCSLGCRAVESGGPWQDDSQVPLVLADLAVARPPYDVVEVDWKQRIDQPYVFVEARGSYTGIGRLLESAFAAASAQAIEPSGPPFALYYDDPGRVPVEELRMRACLPITSIATPQAPLGFDVLESTTVAYAFVAGPYPDVPRAYPKLFDFMARLNWVENGPVREIYLRAPQGVTSTTELVTEIQIPATQAR